MHEKQKEYNGIWKQAGCILSVIAILTIMAMIIMGFYFLWSGL